MAQYSNDPSMLRWVSGLALIATVLAAVSIAIAQPQHGGGGGSGNPPPPRQGPNQSSGQQQGSNQQGPPQGQYRRGPTSRPSPDQLFDRADTNHDGVLSREEFKQFLAHMPPPPPPRQGQGNGPTSRPAPPPPPPAD